MINPIGDLLVVTPATNRCKSNVLLPDWKRQLTGTVRATGNKVRSIRIGDIVGFGAAKGMDAVYAGQEVRIMREDDVDFVYEA